MAIPRVTALRLSPDGSWLAAAVQTVGGEPPAYVTSIWRIPVPGDAAPGPGDGLPARLTRSAEGEGSPEFLPDGAVLFISKRPDPARGRGKGADAGGPDADPGRDKPALWLLPAGGGEARRVAAPPGGVSGIATARGGGTVVFASPALPGSAGPDDDRKRRQARKDAGVTAILHESGALRYWDHDLGPDSPRLQLAGIPGPGTRAAAGPGGATALAQDEDLVQARDLTPDPGRALDENTFDITPDGARVVTGWSVWDQAGNKTDQVEVIDAATGERRTLLAAPGCDFADPRVSPDGRLVACLRATQDSYEAPGDVTLVIGTTIAGSTVAGCEGAGGRGAGVGRAPAGSGYPRRTGVRGLSPGWHDLLAAWTGDRPRRPGRRTRGRSTSPPTTRAGARCSAPTWRPGRSPG